MDFIDDKCQNIISGLDTLLVPAMEEYSDISIFFKDSDFFLDGYQKNNPDKAYVEPLCAEGVVYTSILRACKELINVNAYTEALRIYDTFVMNLEMVSEDVSNTDKRLIQDSIDTIQGLILSTMRIRDDYYSKRKSIISKYSGILKDEIL